MVRACGDAGRCCACVSGLDVVRCADLPGWAAYVREAANSSGDDQVGFLLSVAFRGTSSPTGTQVKGKEISETGEGFVYFNEYRITRRSRRFPCPLTFSEI